MVDRLLHWLADLLHFVKIIWAKRCPGLTKVTNVKGHATDEMVVSGQVGALDKAGND